MGYEFIHFFQLVMLTTLRLIGVNQVLSFGLARDLFGNEMLFLLATVTPGNSSPGDGLWQISMACLANS